jgi:hypothetical protein
MSSADMARNVADTAAEATRARKPQNYIRACWPVAGGDMLLMLSTTSPTSSEMVFDLGDVVEASEHFVQRHPAATGDD